MKKLSALVIAFLCCHLAWSQNLQVGPGVVNKYAAVKQFIGQCSLLGDSLELKQFVRGEKILIAQMKGAIIDTTDSPAFGNLISTGNAGKIEINEVDTVIQDTLVLRFQTLINYETNNMVQIVSIPTAPRITTVGVVRAKPWDGRTGGILILNAIDTLILGGNINLDTCGFRGGEPSTPNVQYGLQNYYFNNVQSGNTETGKAGMKGESIVNISVFKERGRGKLYMGGGGGNNHNTGGGGGANFGNGGKGGNESTAAVQFGLVPQPTGGLGGIGAGYTNNFNLFWPGSGAGGAHQNESVRQGGKGGNGGGLVILMTNRLFTAGNTISANGQNQTLLTGRDGSAGGGSGGTVVLDVNNFFGQVRISVRGGFGGSLDNANNPQSHGPGGGGGGGAVMFRSNIPAGTFIDASGGNAGIITNPNSPDFGTSYGASNGTAGGSITGISIPRASVRCSNSFVLAIDDDVTTFVNFPVSIRPKLNDLYTSAVFMRRLSGPFFGTAFINATNDTLVYTPQSFFSGNDSIIYELCDNFNGICDTAVIRIKVLPLILVAIDDTVSAQINTPVWINPFLNDFVPAQNNLSLGIVRLPGNGTITTIPGTDSIRYIPNPGFLGKDTIVYSICFTGGSIPLCDTALIIIQVNPIPIQAVNDTVKANINTPVIIPPLVNDQTVPGVSITITCPPKHGNAVVITSTGIQYTPTPGFVGKDTICYMLCAPTPTVPFCDTALIFINVEPYPIDLKNDTVTTVSNTPVIIDPKSNDSIPPGPTSIIIACPPKHGGAQISQPGGLINYTPAPGYSGKDTLCYTVCLLQPNPKVCDTAYIFINVQPINLIAVDDTVTVKRNIRKLIDPRVNDIFNNQIRVGHVSIPQNPRLGTITLIGDSVIRYTPNQNITGRDTILYQICVNTAVPFCDSAKIFIQIENLNLDLQDDQATTLVNSPVTIYQFANDIIDTGATKIVAIVPGSGPKNGTASLVGDSIIYSPFNGYIGGDTLRYVVALQTDVSPVTDTATIYIQVLNPGIRPRNDAATTIETTPVTVPFFSNDTRPSSLTTYFKTNPTVTPKNGLVNFDLSAGTATYTANSGFTGKDTVGYYLCAGLPNGEYCMEAIIVITVEKRIFNVKANNDTVFTRANTPVVFNPTINDRDSNNVQFAGVTILSPPNRGTFSQNQLLIRYVPQTDFVGTDRMRYKVCNGLTPPICDSADIVVYVLPAEPPIIPSGFSPNGDNINDFFVIENIKEYSNPKITIINRWGNEVWAGQPYRDNWNGVNRNNEPLPAGTYFYLLELGPDFPIYRGYIVIQR